MVPVMSWTLLVAASNTNPSMLKLATAPFGVSVNENGPVVSPGTNSVKNTLKFDPPVSKVKNGEATVGFGVRVTPGGVTVAFKL
jgi:hypothetical protein